MFMSVHSTHIPGIYSPEAMKQSLLAAGALLQEKVLWFLHTNIEGNT